MKCLCSFVFLVDWSLANFVAIRQNSIGQIRYVIKDLLKYIPFFGPYFMQVRILYFLLSLQGTMTFSFSI